MRASLLPSLLLLALLAVVASAGPKAARVDEVPQVAGVEYHNVEVRWHGIAREPFHTIRVSAWKPASASDEEVDRAASAILDAWRAFPLPRVARVEVYLADPSWKADTTGRSEGAGGLRLLKPGERGFPWFARRVGMANAPAERLTDEHVEILFGGGLGAVPGKPVPWGESRTQFQDALREEAAATRPAVR